MNEADSLRRKEDIAASGLRDQFNADSLDNKLFIFQLQALHRPRINENDNSIIFMSLFIMCFFILIEITPVLAKVLASKGGYDFYLEDLTNQERAIVELNQLKRKEAMSYYYKHIGISHENENLKNQSYEDEEE
jgi:hypothetical protein